MVMAYWKVCGALHSFSSFSSSSLPWFSWECFRFCTCTWPELSIGFQMWCPCPFDETKSFENNPCCMKRRSDAVQSFPQRPCWVQFGTLGPVRPRKRKVDFLGTGVCHGRVERRKSGTWCSLVFITWHWCLAVIMNEVSDFVVGWNGTKVRVHGWVSRFSFECPCPFDGTKSLENNPCCMRRKSDALSVQTSSVFAKDQLCVNIQRPFYNNNVSMWACHDRCSALWQKARMPQ